MVKQLRCPTSYIILSLADLGWNELVSITSKINNLKLSKEGIEKISYHDRCSLLNSNPVLVTRHVLYRL